MANYSVLKAAIADVIKQNGNNEITGNLLQQSLLSMIDALGAGYQYGGVATPAGNPGTPDYNVFYIAMSPGQYVGYGDLSLTDGEIAILKYNGTWAKDSTNIASGDSVNLIRSMVDGIVKNAEYLIDYLALSVVNNPGYYVSPSNGNLVFGTDYTASDFIPVSPSTTYSFWGFHATYGAWYDENKNYISGIQYDADLPDGATYTSPANAKYLRISTRTQQFATAQILLYGDITPTLNPRISFNIPQEYTEQVEEYVNNKINTVVPGIANGVIDFSKLTSTNPGKYVAPGSGNLGTLDTYTATDFLPVEGSRGYACFGFGNAYGAWYDENKNYISGIQYDSTVPDGMVFESPSNAAYMRISTITTKFVSAAIADSELYLSNYVKIRKQQIDGLGNVIQIITITVKPSGGGDFTKLSDAFDSITDSAFDKRYIVEFYGDGTEYDTLLDKPFVDGQIGLAVPAFTKLVGIGGKKKNILVRRLETSNQNDSLLNLRMTSELQGFTLIASNTRYVVHDDFYQQKELNTGFERKISDVECIGGSLYYGVVWGAGNRSGANWVFENCIFKSENGALNFSYTCHNNTGFLNPTSQKFINCRFLTKNAENKYCRFGTLNTGANGIDNLVNFYGCVVSGIWLFEENPNLYGAGILFHVSGFANDIKTGNPNIIITNTDGQDYTANIDLI